MPVGIDFEGIDESVRPQDDLFRHINGTWLKNAKIDPDKSSAGSFIALRDASEKNVHEIVEECTDAEPGSTRRKVGDLFASFMNTDRVNELGAKPAQPFIEKALAVDSIESFMRTLGELESIGVSGLFELAVFEDLGDPNTQALYAAQGGLTLPDEDYYRSEDHRAAREQLPGAIEKLLTLAGVDDASARAERVMKLETEIAKHHWSAAATRDIAKQYNPRTWDEFAAYVGAEKLNPWRAALEAPEQSLDHPIVMQIDFFEALGGILVEENLDALRDWLVWNVVKFAAPYLSENFSAESFRFFGTVLTGSEVERERWKRGVSLTEGALGEAIGEVYVERHFPPDAKAACQALVDTLLDAYRDSIEKLEWMSDETRERALEKLSKFRTKIGYPEKWRDYSKLAVASDDLLGNVIAVNRFTQDHELSKVGKPTDKEEWGMFPQTVNAYYNPTGNEIVFPAAILQLPFFSPDRDAAANYGAIGAVIGHEIGHGFDDQGAQFDGDGVMRNWWSDADLAAFKERTKALIDQYNGLRPAALDSGSVNGELTVGENIGDLGGLTIAWKAYLKSLGGEEPPVIDGLTGAQRFFYSWASQWQEKSRTERAKMRLTIDPHSPNEFRCNQIVSNMADFYEAFDVKEGDALYLAPEKRVAIW